MRIAIRGGGIYGCVIADVLSFNHDVTVYEKENDILTGASFNNFRRIHRGSHYPLSPETAKECREWGLRFFKKYAGYCKSMPVVYWIAGTSRVTPNDYLRFMRDLWAGEFCYKVENPWEWDRHINAEKIEIGCKVEEAIYIPEDMRKHFRAAFEIKTGETPTIRELEEKNDFVIDAVYKDSDFCGLYRRRKTKLLRFNSPSAFMGISHTILYGHFAGVVPYENGFLAYTVPEFYDVQEQISFLRSWFPCLKETEIDVFAEQEHISPVGEDRPYEIIKQSEKTIGVIGGKCAQSLKAAYEIKEMIDDTSAVTRAA